MVKIGRVLAGPLFPGQHAERPLIPISVSERQPSTRQSGLDRTATLGRWKSGLCYSIWTILCLIIKHPAMLQFMHFSATSHWIARRN